MMESTKEKIDDYNNTNGYMLNKTQGAVITESELNFVDLAGSEKISQHMDDIADTMIA